MGQLQSLAMRPVPTPLWALWEEVNRTVRRRVNVEYQLKPRSTNDESGGSSSQGSQRS